MRSSPVTPALLVGVFAALSASAQSIDRFVLVDAVTDTPITAFDPLVDGAEINLAELANASVTVVAVTSPATVGSVVFQLSGAEIHSQTESAAPYALFGDTSGNFNAWSPNLGAYALTATPFTQAGGGGTSGSAATIEFTVINQAGPANEPPDVDAGADQTLPAAATTATLLGTASDPDGTIAKAEWSQVGGPAATIITPSSLTTAVSGLVEALYVFRLSATDNAGAASFDDVVVRVGEPETSAIIGGELQVWKTLTLSYTGPQADESDAINPFLDYRMDVTFTTGDRTLVVPGFFAADGNALASGAAAGSVWRVRFTPDVPGVWSYAARFRSGSGVAISDDALAGSSAFFDGDSGTLTIAPADPAAPGFHSKGRLVYDGTHYLRLLGTGRPFIKGGVDSPENWLGYTGFDNTVDGGAGPSTPDGLHAFPTHEADWSLGDPDWNRHDPPGVNNGRAIIGALNYLQSTGVNNIYFLPMNIGGDGKDSWPYVGPIDPSGSAANDNTRFDVSKLEQWEVFFSHAQRLGIMLHVVLNEAEAANKQELDDAQLGPERRLFYRELVARFGHHNALIWNISEEYNLGLNLGAVRVLEWAAYLKSLDPYGHPVTVHNAGNPQNTASGPWAPFIGQEEIDLTSLQDAGRTSGWGGIVENYRAASAAAGKPIPVMIDEPGSPTRDFNEDYDAFRKAIIWPVLLSGGGGEWFINNRDQSLEDFREFDQLWRDTGRAVRFIEDNLPIEQMTPADGLLSMTSPGFDGPQAMALAGEVYAAHLPGGGGATLDLGTSPDVFDVRWFNPRADEPLQIGSVAEVAGPGLADLGLPPDSLGDDWALLVRRRLAPCPADLTGDGAVNASDLAALIAAWGQLGVPADFAGDGVGSDDLAVVLSAWGPCS